MIHAAAAGKRGRKAERKKEAKKQGSKGAPDAHGGGLSLAATWNQKRCRELKG